MISPSDKSLLNPDRMGRNVECTNPTHPIVHDYSNSPEPKCPICGNTMVTIIKKSVQISDKNELAE